MCTYKLYLFLFPFIIHLILMFLSFRSWSYVMTNGKSVCQGLWPVFSVRKLFSECCCLVSVGRSLWRVDGYVICHSQSIVIYQYLHQGFMFHVLYSSAIYMQYIYNIYKSFFQSRLGTTDYAQLVTISCISNHELWLPWLDGPIIALLVTISSNYHSSIETWTVV
jgi:hypothetical protein